MKERKMKSLGMPQFIAAGMLDRNNVKYRFMIMERFGTDLQKLFEANHKSFSRKAVLQLALRVVRIDCYVLRHFFPFCLICRNARKKT